jgi:hypothetical protein
MLPRKAIGNDKGNVQKFRRCAGFRVVVAYVADVSIIK